MDPLVKRVNELYKKSKEEGLTPAETQEQAQLRRKYLDQVKGNLVQTLNNTVFIDEQGNETPIKKKEKEN